MLYGMTKNSFLPQVTSNRRIQNPVKIERFAKRVKTALKRLTIFAKHSILDVSQGSGYAST